MYKYDLLDQSLVDERVAQYKGQLTRFLNKELTLSYREIFKSGIRFYKTLFNKVTNNRFTSY